MRLAEDTRVVEGERLLRGRRNEHDIWGRLVGGCWRGGGRGGGGGGGGVLTT